MVWQPPSQSTLGLAKPKEVPPPPTWLPPPPSQPPPRARHRAGPQLAQTSMDVRSSKQNCVGEQNCARAQELPRRVGRKPLTVGSCCRASGSQAARISARRLSACRRRSRARGEAACHVVSRPHVEQRCARARSELLGSSTRGPQLVLGVARPLLRLWLRSRGLLSPAARRPRLDIAVDCCSTATLRHGCAGAARE